MTPPLPPDDDALVQRLRQAVLTLPDVPAWATERALAVWRAPAAARGGLVPRLRALLRFDSTRVTATALALRGSGALPRQLLFSAAGHDLDLRVMPSAAGQGGFCLRGQLLGPSLHGLVSWWPEPAQADGAPLASAELDELGEFALDGVPAGEGVLRVALDDTEIELPPFDPASGAGPAPG